MAEILKGLPIAEYHRVPSPWVSHSRIRDFVEHGPKFFEQRYITGERAKEETEHFNWGNAFEILWQQGGAAFREAVAVRPAHLKGTTVAGKEWAAANAHKIRISDADYQDMLQCIDALKECAKGMALIEHAEDQVTLRAHHWGLPLQARPDYVVLDHMRPIIIDLKTTKNLGDLVREVFPGVWEAAPGVWKLGYHSQLALGRKLLELNGYPDAACYLLVVEKTGLRSACIEIPGGMLRDGERYLEAAAPRLAQCLETGHFPRAVQEIVRVETPRWMERQDEVRL